MTSIFEGIRTWYNGLCWGSTIDEVDETEASEEAKKKFARYVSVLNSECAVCFDPFSKTDFIARIIIGTECYHHFHKECLAEWKEKKLTCPMCVADLNTENNGQWDQYLSRIDKKVRTVLGLRDEEIARELQAREKAEQQAIQKQVEEDAKLAREIAKR